jgi:hypothetical protein
LCAWKTKDCRPKCSVCVLIEEDQERFMTIYMDSGFSTPILSLYIEMFSIGIYEHYQSNT